MNVKDSDPPADQPADHQRLRESLGAYVLRQLPPEDADEVRAHLEECPTCPDELDQLLPVAGALRLADVQRISAADPPPQLVERITAAVRSERRRSVRERALRRGAPYAGVAAAAVLGAVVALGVTEIGRDPGPPIENVAVSSSVPGVEAEAALVAHTWGTEIKLVASGLSAGSYRVSVRDDAGREVAAGTFLGTARAPLQCSLNAATLRRNARAFVVSDERGRVVLRSAFSSVTG